MVYADGGREMDVVHSMNEGNNAWGALRSVVINRICERRKLRVK